MKVANKVIAAYKDWLEAFKEAKEAEIELLNGLRSNALTVDGIPSDDGCIFVE